MFSLELEFVVAVKVVLVSCWKRFRSGEINVRQRKETVCLMCWIWRSNRLHACHILKPDCQVKDMPIATIERIKQNVGKSV